MKHFQSLFIVFLFSICIPNVNGQVVKFIKNPLTAKYRVYVTQQPSEATLFVYKTKNTRRLLEQDCGILLIIRCYLKMQCSYLRLSIKRRQTGLYFIQRRNLMQVIKTINNRNKGLQIIIL